MAGSPLLICIKGDFFPETGIPFARNGHRLHFRENEDQSLLKTHLWME